MRVRVRMSESASASARAGADAGAGLSASVSARRGKYETLPWNSCVFAALASRTSVHRPRVHSENHARRTPTNARTHSHPSVSARRHRRELPHRQNGDLVRVCTLHIVPAHMCFVCACARYVRVVARRLFLCVHRAHICVREIVCACVPGLTLVWQQLR